MKNERGFVVLPFAVVMAAVIIALFVYGSQKTKQLTDKVARVQGVAYGNEIAVKLAQRLRWAYDASRADAANAALGLCTSFGGTNTAVGTFQLCLIGGQICVQHPQVSSQNVCISVAAPNPSIIAKFGSPSILRSLIPEAVAQQTFIPAEPAAGSTAIVFSASTTSCIGGECRAICGAAGNADCLTYKFCPLVGTCSANQMVWQTVAFFR